MGRTAKNPEAAEASEEEVQEADWSSVVGSKPFGAAKYAKVLETGQQMVVLIITLMELAGI